MKRFLLFSMICCLSSLIFSQPAFTIIKENKNLQPLFAVDSTYGLLLDAGDSTLWATNGTAAGTTNLSRLIHYVSGAGFIGGKCYFVGKTDSSGKELYVTNGTKTGTKLVKDINVGIVGSDPENFTVLNNKLYFTAVTLSKGRELWRSSGTAAGTVLVKDIVAGTGSSNIASKYQMFSNGTHLYFSAKSTGKGYELWKSDGSAAGTVLLKDINPTVDSSSNPGYFARFGNMVLFQATTTASGTELWKTDGTTAGTVMVKEIAPGNYSSINYLSLFTFKNKGYFVANNLATGNEIWVTDGSNAGTSLLKDIWPGFYSSYAQVYSAVTVGNIFIFTAYNTTNGFEMWKSDGTPAGTTIFKDIVPGTNSGNPILLPAYKWDAATGTLIHPLLPGNKFFLRATTTAAGSEMWVCNGTVAGTTMLKDIKPGATDGIPNPSYFYCTTKYYFIAENGVNGSEMWQSDGTAAGTTMVADINPGAGNSNIKFGFVVNHKLVFEANNGDIPSKSDLCILNTVVTALRTPSQQTDLLNEDEPLTLKITGNPVRSQLNYAVSSTSGKGSVTIADINGRKLYNGTFVSGENNTLSVSQLKPGMYMLMVENGVERKTVKFIKE